MKSTGTPEKSEEIQRVYDDSGGAWPVTSENCPKLVTINLNGRSRSPGTGGMLEKRQHLPLASLFFYLIKLCASEFNPETYILINLSLKDSMFFSVFTLCSSAKSVTSRLRLSKLTFAYFIA